MRLMAPADYEDFACLASACRHTCCAGWEIDIDPETAALYGQVPGPCGARLRACIRQEEEGFSFALDAEDRCPMLRKDGLCEIILRLGPEALCQICADHPRFRNDFSDRVEIGLGLCCEAAAWQLVSRREPFRLIVLEEDGSPDEPTAEEAAFFHLRERLFSLAQAEDSPWTSRAAAIAAETGLGEIPDHRLLWPGPLGSMEVLDPAWPALLETLDRPPVSLLQEEAFDRASGQLAVYFLYRHLPGALEDGMPASRVRFALSAVGLIRRLTMGCPGASLADLADMARRFSSEVEYSQENLSAALQACGEK